MGQAGRFLRRTTCGYSHWCPGCEEVHHFAVDRPLPYNQAQWAFSGDLERPTFTPSMNIRWGTFADPGFVETDPSDSGVCHYHLRNGEIEFLADSTHALKGQKVQLPELPELMKDPT